MTWSHCSRQIFRCIFHTQTQAVFASCGVMMCMWDELSSPLAICYWPIGYSSWYCVGNTQSAIQILCHNAQCKFKHKGSAKRKKQKQKEHGNGTTGPGPGTRDFGTWNLDLGTRAPREPRAPMPRARALPHRLPPLPDPDPDPVTQTQRPRPAPVPPASRSALWALGNEVVQSGG
jgi:hypothetical protein